MSKVTFAIDEFQNYNEQARVLTLIQNEVKKIEEIAIYTGGTGDIPVAEEAYETAKFYGSNVKKYYDIGIAEILRLFDKINNIKKANVIIAIARMERALSGSIPISNLLHFSGLMQAIHLPIGIFEGIVCGIIFTVSKFVDSNKLSYALGGTSLVLAGIISNYASNKPDGLEWSLLNISDSVVMHTQGILYNLFETFQSKVSVFANLPYTLGNIAGLIVLALIMYFMCLILNKKQVLENE